MSRVIVVGGGAAGMLAAISAAYNGHEVTLYEKNEKLGKKIFITGKGRCNITNACDEETLLNNVVTNKKFLYSAFYNFSSDDMMKLLENNGLKLKIERGDRVFPESDHSSDVIATLKKILNQLGVNIQLNTIVEKIIAKNGVCKGVLLADKQEKYSNAVIVATGGLSYATTGSTGDGYKFAKDLGHNITELTPALVPIETKELYIKELQGLSLRNVSIKIMKDNKNLYESFGEMLFTHYGVSGPIILSASSFIAKYLKKEPLKLLIDLKPALTTSQLDARILRDFSVAMNKQFRNVLGQLYPAKLIPIIIEKSGISPEKQVNEISKIERQRLVEVTKNFDCTLIGFRDYKEAIITQGGISLKEISSSTMESKLISGLYFAGEVLDLDAVTGGFNLQIAWSTGYLAGNSIAYKD
jgi:flavoprotein, HI0933 family